MKTFPMDSLITGLDDQGLPIFDRPCNAQDLQDTMMTFFKDGVFSEQSDELQVFPSGGGMTVNVHPGRCLIRGAQGMEETRRTLQLQAADENLDRIDTVVARLDKSVAKRAIDLYIVKGLPALSPKAPELTRNSTVWEIGLADLYIPKGITTVSEVRISDTRLNEQRCGFVSPFVQLQTKTFYDELQRQTDIAIQLAKDAIEETVAGKLQAAIDELNAKFPVAISDGGTGATDAPTAWGNLRQKPELLWQGTCKKGQSIPVPGANKYNAFIIRGDSRVILFAARLVIPEEPFGANELAGGTVTGYRGGQQRNAVAFTGYLEGENNETFRLYQFDRIVVPGGKTVAQDDVKAIWGLM